MATEHTYTGAEDSFFNGGKKSAAIGFAAIILAALAMILAVLAWMSASSVENFAQAVATDVSGLAKSQAETAVVNNDRFQQVAVRLANQATQLTLMGEAMVKLESKSVVAQLADELRKGKASKAEVSSISSQLFDKADKKSVDRLARRIGRFDKRINNLVELNKLIEIAPPAASESEIRRKATTPAGEAIRAEQARIDAERAVPVGRPEAPAGKMPPPAK